MHPLEQYKQYGFPQEWINNSLIAYLNGQGYNIKYKVGNYYVDP